MSPRTKLAFIASVLLPVAWSRAAIRFEFDFTYDASGFFTRNPDRVTTLNNAANYVASALANTSLAAVTSSGVNHLNVTFPDPRNLGATIALSDQSIPADTIRVYVGAYRLARGNTISYAETGGFTWTGAFSFGLLASSRASATGTGLHQMPWGGSIAFDTAVSWYFDPDDNLTPNEIRAGNYDFFTMAVHELLHVIGLGNLSAPASSFDGNTFTNWSTLASTISYLGAAATAANGGVRPALASASDRTHWAQGTMSWNYQTGSPQEALMVPIVISFNQRKYLTAIDVAALVDLGFRTAGSAPAANPPAITIASSRVDVVIGGSVLLTVNATGDAPLRYQWQKDGAPIAGATNATLAISPARIADAGDYTSAVSNAAGTATSSAITLRVTLIPPVITLQPESAVAAENDPVTFTARASANPDPVYQWFHDGATVPGARSPTLVISRAALSDAGSYTCTATNDAGSATTTAAILTVTRAARIINLSTRGFSDGSPIVSGFVVEGRGPLPALVRAIGPTLAVFGIPSGIPDPQLQLFSSGSVVDQNDDWSASLLPVFASTGAFALGAGSKDAALVAQVQPGAFTVSARDRSGRAGDVLLEIYDASGATSTAGFINASTLGTTGAGRMLVSGFVVSGSGQITVLVRAVGPELRRFGVPSAAGNPQVELFHDASRIAANAGWSTAGNAPAIASAGIAAGAFPLANGSNDAALLVNLAAGNYTAQTSAADGATVSVLFELYLVR